MPCVVRWTSSTVWPRKMIVEPPGGDCGFRRGGHPGSAAAVTGVSVPLLPHAVNSAKKRE